ncbi:hemin uptake protein HemP [Neptunicoccus cionae]|uniref:Hemin uptake protein HemP n=1 Tax=Neptunicoccus cionae TaxID=2035344 RepID=A0A916QYQ2_9RHOB|nr:hemin uptake protein HemP [Amylibacter cionae]GGA20053.1 hemin uptake protein HemP [Amylibacter cionae]
MTTPPTRREPAPNSLPDDGLPVYDAHKMLAGNTTARIQLDDQTYILRLTRQGKLILTK